MSSLEPIRRPAAPLPRLTALALLALATLGLGGCAQLRPAPEIREVRVEVPVQVPVLLPGDAAARQLLAYHERLRAMSPAELAQEVAPRDDAALPPAAATQLALALMANHGAGELARAQALLDAVLRGSSPEAPDWQPLARLLAARLAEQRRLEEQIERLNQQARDAQRDNQRRLDQLNEKLEALKAIERSLN
ncbi:MAG: hypothetical protein ABW005_00295, partial [Burkholderiaceae bacterium]